MAGIVKEVPNEALLCARRLFAFASHRTARDRRQVRIGAGQQSGKENESGADYWSINPKGQVPVLEFDNGERLTDGPVVVQWIADQNPAAGLIPPAGKPERYRVQEWLNFITSELHKSFGPIFRPTTPDAYKTISKENLGKRFDWLDKQLANKQYLMGDKFTVADAYLFTVLRWTARINMDLAKWPNLKAYVDRVAARPKVEEALKAEGLLQ
jgi:glutathione S-transferase